MYQVPQAVWNEIAESVPLKHQWAEQLFRLDPEAATEELESQAKALQKQGATNRVISAYQEVAPLLAENEAISQYIVKTGSLGLRRALPEVTTPLEAVNLAQQDHHMNHAEAKRLYSMLEKTMAA